MLLSGRALQNVRAAIKDLNDLTCVTLRKKRNSDRGYININANEDGCFSWLGYTGSEQVRVCESFDNLLEVLNCCIIGLIAILAGKHWRWLWN